MHSYRRFFIWYAGHNAAPEVKKYHLEDLEKPPPTKTWKWPFYMRDPSFLELKNLELTPNSSSSDVASRIQPKLIKSAVDMSEKIDRSFRAGWFCARAIFL